MADEFNPTKWQPIIGAPKGEVTEDCGCRGNSIWFLGLSDNGDEIEICRRAWPHEDCWKDREETYYSANWFTHWKPMNNSADFVVLSKSIMEQVIKVIQSCASTYEPLSCLDDAREFLPRLLTETQVKL